MNPKVLINFIITISIIVQNLNKITSIKFPKEASPTKSGYLVVNTTTKSSIFYTFYEAQQPITPLPQTPLLIWLQGGPGCSSMTGNFYELGPWRVNRSLMLEPNLGSWNRLFGLVFFDNPIGTGFSVASNIDEIPRDQHGVAMHLYAAIRRFLKLDYELYGKRPVYITGESYAGKYVPSIAYYILSKNDKVSKASHRINLGGVAVGNGLTDPETQVKTHGLNAYYSGLINEAQRAQLEEIQRRVVELVEEKQWADATDARSLLLETLQNMTGLATLYDLRRKIPYESGLVVELLRNAEVRKALGVTKRSGVYEECSEAAAEALHEDVMKSVKYKVEYLLQEKCKVLLYQGQTDLRDGVVSVEAYMRKLKWDGNKLFQKAAREVWRVDGEVAGYVQKWGSLSHVVVLGAGHFVPTDQAVNSQAMIEDWVLGRRVFGDYNNIDSTLQNL